MSNQALSFIGRLDRREESIVMSNLQQQAFVKRLLGNRDSSQITQKLFGSRLVRDVYCPPTRGLNGTSPVMSKN